MAKHCEYVQQLEHLKIPLDKIESVISKYKTIKEWAYIVHDKDIDKNGSPKKPHIHLYLNFGKSGAKFETVAKWFNDNPQYVTNIIGRKSDVLQYLTHANAPEKHQYSIDEVKSNFDIAQAIIKDRELHSLNDEIDDIVFEFAQEIITYSQAVKKIQEIKLSCKNYNVLKHLISVSETVEKLWKQQCKISTKGKRDMQIIFIYGDSGSGKSTYAEMYAKMLCAKKGYRDFCRSSASNDILQDYMGEDILILDDYRDVDETTGKAESLTDVLKMLDPHFASSSRSRYVNKTFMGKLIIITSTKDPLQWFKGTKEQRWQFFRRISMLIEIDRKNVTEYQETNNEKGIPFLCGFKHDGAYIEKAAVKKVFPSPVPEYVAIVKTTNEEENDISADISSFLDELRKEKNKSHRAREVCKTSTVLQVPPKTFLI